MKGTTRVKTEYITPYLRPGQTNRIELWPLDSRNGRMNESNIIIHQLEIGCAVE